MKKLNLLMLAFVALVAWSCTSSMKYTWTNESYEGRKFEKVLVVAEASTQQGRIRTENAIVERLTKEGINAENSLSVFPETGKIHDLSEDEIENKILSGGYDGVLVTSLVDAKTRDVREGGGTYMQPVGYRYGRRIRTGYVHMQEPEYYRQEKTYVLETQFFDTKDAATKENVVWSGQSELTDPSSADSAAKTYSKKLTKTLLETGIVKL